MAFMEAEKSAKIASEKIKQIKKLVYTPFKTFFFLKSNDVAYNQR